MRFDKSSRRMFLQGAGAFTLSIPFLGSLVRDGRAATPSELKRFIVVHTPYGSVSHTWYPSDASRNMSPLSSRAKGMKLSDLSEPSEVFQRNVVEPVLPKMVLLDGIDALYAVGHERSYPLTGFREEDPSLLPAPSIDQIIAEKAAIYQSTPVFQSFALAGGPDTGVSISYADTGSGIAPLPHYTSPDTVWDAAFAQVANDPEQIAKLEALKAQRLSVLDHVLADYHRLKGHARLSQEDRLKLEAYTDHLSDFQTTVLQTEAVSCSVPPRPDVASYPPEKQSWDAQLTDLVSIVVHMVRCGLTNVLTFSLASKALQYANLGQQMDHHGLTHGKDSPNLSSVAAVNAQLTEISQFHAKHVVELVKGLDTVEDPSNGRTFLDNSVVLWTTDMGSVANHKGARFPCALFGAKGYLKQDLLIDYRSPYELVLDDDQPFRIGVSYNQLLVTLCQLMGLAPDEYEHGQQGVGNYNVSSYYANKFPSEQAYIDYAFGDRRTPLHEIFEG